MLGTITDYPWSTDENDYELCALLLADASRVDEFGHLGVPTGLFVGEMKNTFICHVIFWKSHKSRRTIKS